MHSQLSLAVSPTPDEMSVPLGEVETAVILRLAPPLNLDKNPSKLGHIRRARAEMAAEAAQWRPET